MKVIIDTDPGTDDALALIMALNSPELDILGLTTVEGNATLADTTRNALAVLEYMGRTDIPVYAGESTPLVGKFEHAYHIHGPAGLTVSLPEPRLEPAAGGAVDFIVETALALDGELTVIALGPLTNIARALMRDERVASAIRLVPVMGGQGADAGNVTPYAEFNIWDDPHAANVVFESSVPTTLIGLDVCRRTAVSRGAEGWFGGDTPGEALAGRILANWFETAQVERQFNLHDPLTIAATLRPELISARAASATVETAGERVGEVSADYARGGSVDLAVDVDGAAAMAFMRELLKG